MSLTKNNWKKQGYKSQKNYTKMESRLPIYRINYMYVMKTGKDKTIVHSMIVEYQKMFCHSNGTKNQCNMNRNNTNLMKHISNEKKQKKHTKYD